MDGCLLRLSAEDIGPIVRLRLAGHAGQMGHFVGQGERVLDIREVGIELRLTKERAHEPQHAHSGIEGVQEGFLHLLPVAEAGIAILGDLLGVEGPDF